MTTKHLADLLQKEARNLASVQVESVNQVDSQEIPTAEESSAELSATVSELTISQTSVEGIVRELEQVITQLEQKEVTLLNQVNNLQTALAVQKASSERSQQELEEAKEMILQLAQSNSQLIAENKGLKQAKEGSKLNNYKKSHLLSEKLTDKPKASDDFTANTWLYD